VTAVAADERRSALKPRALIVTTYGAFARDAGGWLPVASLIRLMAELGVDEPSVRSSISRLKRRGILAAATVDGAAGYELSAQAREILAEGDRRIFQRPESRVSDGWVLVVYSVPESERDRRHILRSKLTWLGFGTAAPGVWIAPAHLYDEARETLARLEMTPYVGLFRADYLAFADVRASARPGSRCRPAGAVAVHRTTAGPSPTTYGRSPTGAGCRSSTRDCPPNCCRTTGTDRAPPTCSTRSSARCTRRRSATSAR
jgi:hypothetical protein